MGSLSRDTGDAAERVQVSILKSLPAWRKVEMVVDACETANSLSLSGLRSRHPNASEQELQRLLMGLLLGEETATRVWGPRGEKG